MASFNKVMLMGNLTRDPQLKYLPNQTAVVEIGLAMNRKFKGSDGADREEVTFVDCTAFGRTAEVINQYCTKGKGLFVEGRLKYDQWEDKQGGGKRSKLSVVIDNFQFIGGGRDGGGPGGPGGDSDSQSAPPPRQANRGPASRPAPSQQQPPYGDEQKFNDEDIPF